MEIASQGVEVPKAFLLTAMGELAIAQFHARTFRECARSLLNAGDAFHDDGDQSTLIRHVGVPFTQTVVLLEAALRGAPHRAPDGTTLIPERGFLQEQTGRHAVVWGDLSPPALCFALCRLAEFVDDHTAAAEWAARAFAGAIRAGGESGTRIALILLPHVLLGHRDDAALAAAAQLGAVFRWDRDPSSPMVFGQEAVVALGLLPLALFLGTKRVMESEQAASATARSLACVWGSVEPVAVDGLRALILAPHEGHLCAHVIAEGKALVGMPPDRALRALTLFQASLCSDTTLPEVLLMQCEMISFVAEDDPLGAALRLVDGFVLEYWSHAFTNNPTAFRTAEGLSEQMRKSGSRGVDTRARLAVRLAAEGLGVELPRKMLSYLEGRQSLVGPRGTA